MTRALIIVAALSAITTAGPSRKIKPDKFKVAAGEAFAKAVAADDKGDLSTAKELYMKSFVLAPHPSTAFNLADVNERLGDYFNAARTYELYLVLAPDAADRAQVRATLTRLEHLPAKLELRSNDDLTNAYVLVDGAIVKRPGAAWKTLDLAAGTHELDVVTATSSTHSDLRLGRGKTDTQVIRFPARSDGVIVSMPHDIEAKIHGKTPSDARIVVAKGRHRVAIKDRKYECAPISIDAPDPASNKLTYLHVEVVELPQIALNFDAPRRCRKLDVKLHELVFP